MQAPISERRRSFAKSSAALECPHHPTGMTHSDRSSERARLDRWHAAANDPSPASPSSRTFSAIWASEVFSECLTECRYVQHRFGQKLLQLPVLLLKRSEATSVRDLHPAKARAPAIEGRMTDPILSTEIRKR